MGHPPPMENQMLNNRCSMDSRSTYDPVVEPKKIRRRRSSIGGRKVQPMNKTKRRNSMFDRAANVQGRRSKSIERENVHRRRSRSVESEFQRTMEPEGMFQHPAIEPQTPNIRISMDEGAGNVQGRRSRSIERENVQRRRSSSVDSEFQRSMEPQMLNNEGMFQPPVEPQIPNTRFSLDEEMSQNRRRPVIEPVTRRGSRNEDNLPPHARRSRSVESAPRRRSVSGTTPIDPTTEAQPQRVSMSDRNSLPPYYTPEAEERRPSVVFDERTFHTSATEPEPPRRSTFSGPGIDHTTFQRPTTEAQPRRQSLQIETAQERRPSVGFDDRTCHTSATEPHRIYAEPMNDESSQYYEMQKQTKEREREIKRRNFYLRKPTFEKRQENGGLKSVENDEFEANKLKDLKEMDENAASHAAKGDFRAAHSILENILKFQKLLFGDTHSDVAKTHYRMGSVLVKLNMLDDAQAHLEDGVRILYPRRKTEANMDLSSIFYLLGVVHSKYGKSNKALYYTKLASQVEFHIKGEVSKKTSKKLRDLTK